MSDAWLFVALIAAPVAIATYVAARNRPRCRLWAAGAGFAAVSVVATPAFLMQAMENGWGSRPLVNTALTDVVCAPGSEARAESTPGAVCALLRDLYFVTIFVESEEPLPESRINEIRRNAATARPAITSLPVRLVFSQTIRQRDSEGRPVSGRIEGRQYARFDL